MTTPREALSAIGDEARTLSSRRRAAVTEARAAGMTWREIAERLGMTEEGVRRAMLRSDPEH